LARDGLSRAGKIGGEKTMSDTGGKSYNETAAFGTDLDLSGEREIEAVRAAKRDGSIEEAEGFGTAGPSSVIGEHVADGVALARDGLSRAGKRAATTASNMSGEVGNLVRSRASEVAGEAKTMASQLVEAKPVHLILGAAFVGYLFGRFG